MPDGDGGPWLAVVHGWWWSLAQLWLVVVVVLDGPWLVVVRGTAVVVDGGPWLMVVVVLGWQWSMVAGGPWL